MPPCATGALGGGHFQRRLPLDGYAMAKTSYLIDLIERGRVRVYMQGRTSLDSAYIVGDFPGELQLAEKEIEMVTRDRYFI